MSVRATITATLLASLGAATFANVRVEAIQDSSPKVHLTVLHERTPFKNAKVEVLDADGLLEKRVLWTDASGIVSLPQLSPGQHHVIATAYGGLRADLYLNVSKNKGKVTLFSVELFVSPPAPPSLRERIAAAENESTTVRLAEFFGDVKDQSGAAVSGTKVEVYRKGAFTAGPVKNVFADVTGVFSSHLSDGYYTAVFISPGFYPEVTVFNVSRNSYKKNLQVVLKVAPVAE